MGCYTYACVRLEVRLAAAGWLGGFGTPPPRLASWLARPRKTAKIRSAPLYRLFSHMVWVWVWVCKGGGGSTTFQEDPYLKLPIAFPLEPPIKTKNTKHRITASDECSTTNVLVTDVKGLPPIPQSTQLSSIRNVYHPYCITYPKAPFQSTFLSPTPHSATCNPTQSHTPSGSEQSILDTCHGTPTYRKHLIKMIYVLDVPSPSETQTFACFGAKCVATTSVGFLLLVFHTIANARIRLFNTGFALGEWENRKMA